MSKETRDTLIAVQNLFLTGGHTWVQDHYGIKENSRCHCLSGAIRFVTSYFGGMDEDLYPKAKNAFRAVARAIPARWDDRRSHATRLKAEFNDEGAIIMWNDATGRTFDEIRDVLAQAIALEPLTEEITNV